MSLKLLSVCLSSAFTQLLSQKYCIQVKISAAYALEIWYTVKANWRLLWEEVMQHATSAAYKSMHHAFDAITSYFTWLNRDHPAACQVLLLLRPVHWAEFYFRGILNAVLLFVMEYFNNVVLLLSLSEIIRIFLPPKFISSSIFFL